MHLFVWCVGKMSGGEATSKSYGWTPCGVCGKAIGTMITEEVQYKKYKQHFFLIEIERPYLLHNSKYLLPKEKLYCQHTSALVVLLEVYSTTTGNTTCCISKYNNNINNNYYCTTIPRKRNAQLNSRLRII